MIERGRESVRWREHEGERDCKSEKIGESEFREIKRKRLIEKFRWGKGLKSREREKIE